jgi:hypothetical protein
MRGTASGTIAGIVAGVLYPAIAFPVVVIVPSMVDPSPYLRFDVGAVLGMAATALLYGWPIGLALGVILGFCAGLGCGVWLAFARRLHVGNIARPQVRVEAAVAAGVSLMVVSTAATMALNGGSPAVTDIEGGAWALALGPLPALIAGGWAALRGPRILMSGFPDHAATTVGGWGTPAARSAAVADFPE